MTFCNSYFTTKNFPSSGLTIFGPHIFASKSVAWIRFLWMMRHFWESLKIRSSQNNLDDYHHDKHHHLQLWIKMERANATYLNVQWQYSTLPTLASVPSSKQDYILPTFPQNPIESIEDVLVCLSTWIVDIFIGLVSKTWPLYKWR